MPHDPSSARCGKRTDGVRRMAATFSIWSGLTGVNGLVKLNAGGFAAWINQFTFPPELDDRRSGRPCGNRTGFGRKPSIRFSPAILFAPLSPERPVQQRLLHAGLVPLCSGKAERPWKPPFADCG